MQSTIPNPERRAWPRAIVPGAACNLIVRATHVGGCTLLNLSAGGARLEGSFCVAVGDDVVIVLMLPRRKYPLRLFARVAHVTQMGDDQCIGVAFVNVVAGVQDAIQSVVLRALETAATARAQEVHASLSP